MAKQTREEYIYKLKIKNPMVEVVDEYVDAKTKIRHRCLVHNICWNIAPNNALQGHGCDLCRREKISKKLSKTHEQYVLDVKNINSNITVLEKYIGANTSILHKCSIDGYEWYCKPANILSGFGCPKCSERFRRTHDDYVLELLEVNPTVEVVGDFAGLQTPILHKCIIHNVEWMAIPDNILRGHRCWKCGNDAIGDKNRKTHKQYVNDLRLLNSDVLVIGTYVNSFTPILHKCLIDNYEWMAVPSNLLSGRGCPQCQESSGERKTRQWLEKHNITYVFQKTFDGCKDKKPLLFDFYLPDYNCCIEYDGLQHFEAVDYFGGESSLKHIQKHDKIKNEYCKKNNINLLRIPYFKNIDEELNNFLFI